MPAADQTDGRVDFVAQLGVLEGRLDQLAQRPFPHGLSEPDPGADERWDAGQIWAHIAEFVPYWQHQAEAVIAGYHGVPVAFGRTKADSARIETIEANRRASVADQLRAVLSSIEELRHFLGGLTPAQRHAVGLHPRRGEMDVEAIVGEFVIHHLEEHADQLDELA